MESNATFLRDLEPRQIPDSSQLERFFRTRGNEIMSLGRKRPV